MKSMTRWLLLTALTLLVPAAAHAQTTDRTLCVFDPSGAHGDAFKMSEKYVTAALAWGVRFDAKPYTNEGIAVSDFKAGKCHAVLLTGLRTRDFVKSTSTLEAMGAAPTYSVLKRTIALLAREDAASLSVSGSYETAGVFPAGAVYLFVRDKSINSMSAVAGRKIATLAYDEAARVMVNTVGASMVSAEMGTFAGIFNNGKADACYAPAVAAEPLELRRGLGSTGGILKMPLAQVTLQVLIRSKDFPAGFGIASRTYASGQFDEALKMTRKAEKDLSKYWIAVDEAQRPDFEAKLRAVRIKLRGKGIYHAKLLKLMRGLRCKADPNNVECLEKLE